MNYIDKFLSDSQRVINTNNSSSQKIIDLERLFSIASSQLGEIAPKLFQYWKETYNIDFEKKIDWLGDLLFLLSNQLDHEPVFTKKDWKEIQEEVSAEADTMDMDILSSIMSTMLQFHAI